MADWGNVYTIDGSPSDDLSIRVRRLERGRQYLRAGSLVTPSGAYVALPSGLLDTHTKLSLASPSVNTVGSIPPNGVIGNFGFSATTTSITIYWDATNSSTLLVLVRANNTAIHIPANNLTINGLTASTTYGFLPFWSPFSNCGVGFIVGDSGSPQFAFSSAARLITNSLQQLFQGREPLSPGFLTFATPATGSSGGSGSGGGYGGGGGTCIMVNTDIKPLGGGDYVTKHYRQTDWINLAVEDYPRTLSCTPDHPLYHADRGKIKAEDFKAGDWIITEHGEMKLAEVRLFYKDCTKVQVEMPTGHLFFANGFLSHNYKPYN